MSISVGNFGTINMGGTAGQQNFTITLSGTQTLTGLTVSQSKGTNATVNFSSSGAGSATATADFTSANAAGDFDTITFTYTATISDSSTTPATVTSPTTTNTVNINLTGANLSTMSTVVNATTTSNATINDTGTVNATDLSTLGGKVGTLDATSVTQINGSYSNLNTLMTDGTITKDGAVKLKVTSGSETAATFNTLLGRTTGDVDLASATISNSTGPNLHTLTQKTNVAGIGSLNVTITNTPDATGTTAYTKLDDIDSAIGTLTVTAATIAINVYCIYKIRRH